MKTKAKLMLAGLTAALTLGAFVAIAPASRFALSNQFFRATWNLLVFRGGGFLVECHVTIEGSFHSRTLSKVVEALVGYVSRAIVDETHCTGGSARALPESLPWHIRYDSFRGTLPIIENIKLRLVNAAFQVQIIILGLPVSCLFKSTMASPLKAIETFNEPRFQAEELKPEGAAIPLVSGSRTCPTSGEIERSSTSLTVLGNTTKITVTLIQ